MTHIDQLNRTIKLKGTPKRIISLVPSQTELLVDLGLENSIVGVTKFCIHPENLRKEKTVVGGTKQIKIERIKNLQPDIILCNKEENTKEIIEQLSGVAPIHISDIYNLDDCFELINMYGGIFQVQEKALKVINSIKNEIQKFRAHFQDRIKQKVAYFIWKNPWMVVGSDTFIDFMVTEAGFENVFKNKARYPEITLDDTMLKEADVIFLSSEPFPFNENHVAGLLEKFPNKHIVIVDGELFSWYGSRLLKSYEFFRVLRNKLSS
ncbi:ABC transporter substrate-binding protein [Winogradskyella ursingii]|uniref:ABC transporter substrate-binding protein n=1 Tax=Winogradskyella ursingii TaxID=2686079 RepID=UPI0015CE8712|nr:helical backbone metal receptor [Winogradskyella ursingii]